MAGHWQVDALGAPHIGERSEKANHSWFREPHRPAKEAEEFYLQSALAELAEEFKKQVKK